ncbi:hypothetical protein Daus18300_013086 [Diaporthe australafricana]|uniref:Uncharacterized protein n=1 Tax=Diaporthe australafricana TaxID=127596 RepID=A0ABR3W0G6_9PEZI
MQPNLAKKAAGQQSVLVRRRLRHAGLGEKKKAWLARNLGKELGHIHSQSLEPCEGSVTSASGFDLLCSYSWRVEPKKEPGKHSSGPQIYVPGEAHVLIPHKLPLAVTRRALSGMKFYRDANTARMRSYPFEPMFQSMSVLNPGFRFDGVDLIINRGSLRHLLSFVHGTADGSFRLDLAMIHNTLIVTPIWERVRERNTPEPRNYGRHFEALFTRRELQDSATHHRAIRYNLGPLSCAVLCETDAALPSSGEVMVSHDERWAFRPHPRPHWIDRSQLSDKCQPNTSAEKVLLRPRDETAPRVSRPMHKPHSQVIPSGTGALSKDVAELVVSANSVGKKMTQLWLGRVPYLVRGFYSNGSFTRVHVVGYASFFACFESQYQGRLRRLVSLIDQLRGFARNATEQRCTVICDKSVRPLRLRIFNPDRIPALPLPVDLRRQFWSSSTAEDQG